MVGTLCTYGVVGSFFDIGFVPEHYPIYIFLPETHQRLVAIYSLLFWLYPQRSVRFFH